MPRQSVHRLSQQVLEQADAGARRLQLRVEFRMDARSSSPGEQLGAIGGEWDLDERRFVGPGTKARVWGVTDLQRDATVYWLAWLRAYVADTREAWAEFHAEHGKRPFSLWTVGGRRRGKTWLGVRALAAFTIAKPDAVPPWLVSPIEDDFDPGKELHREWVKALPPSWYEWNERDLYIQMVHGPRILMFSAHDSEKLKNGAVGYAFWNEVQKSKARLRGLGNIRGGAADTGTLVHAAANPPKDADEYWIDEVLTKLETGEAEGKLFDFRGDNPYVHEEALDSMKGVEMTERDYLIDRKGMRLPRPDIVLWAYEDSLAGNLKPVPETGELTEAFLKRKLGRPFASVVLCDFQRKPHQVGIVEQFFECPDDPEDAISIVVDEVYVEQGDEYDLIDALELHGWRGSDAFRCLKCGAIGVGVLRSCVECGNDAKAADAFEQLLATAVIADATGDYQQADRKRGKITGKGSFDIFRERGWRHLFKPDKNQERNPHIDERCAIANTRLRSVVLDEKGEICGYRRRAFVAPHCTQTREHLKKWPNNKQGQPSRWSIHAHGGDGFTYGKIRLWPRRLVAKAGPPRIDVVDIHGREERGV